MEICDFLKSWKRMCNSMTEMNGCEDCPIVRNTHGARCGDTPCEMQDVESIAREVEKWAAEHPEPVYPSWLTYLMDAYPDCGKAYMYGNDALWKWMWTTPIPADIAEKLGIEPKEG